MKDSWVKLKLFVGLVGKWLDKYDYITLNPRVKYHIRDFPSSQIGFQG